jgi:heat shock protein HslJ
MLSAPKPELAYTGPLMVLVDGKCASACEYFSQTLQKLGRAQIMGQYTTDGAGGPVDEIKLPEGMTFHYTHGRTTFAGTDEYNLEAKGVVPDIRVPVTLESEQAKRTGKDPVLDAAVAELSREGNERVAKLVAQPWQWVSYKGADASFEVKTPANYTLTFSDPETGEVKVKADCSNVDGFFMLQGSNLSVRTAPMEPAACAGDSRSEQFLKLVAAALPAQFAIEDGKLSLVLKDGSTMVFAPVAAAAVPLAAQPWQWESFQGATDEFKVDAPAKYTATFAGDGSLSITADCKKASGTYTDDGGALTIVIGPMTKAACPSGSRSDEFVKLLGSAARYFAKDGKLYIDLMADAGTMAFALAE